MATPDHGEAAAADRDEAPAEEEPTTRPTIMPPPGDAASPAQLHQLNFHKLC